NGVGGFSATLKTAGSQTITATDTVNPSITGTSAAITVNAGTATKLAVSAPGTVTTNVAFNFTVTAQDAYNNTVTSFADTIHFSSSDGSAVLPANSTLTNGVKAFSATLKTNGAQTITATDLANGAIMGASGSINVTTALTVTTASLNPLDVGQTATQTLTASGGSGILADYSWSWTAQAGSSLPPGLALSSAGVISGSPTTAGSYNVTVKVSDSGSSTNATANLTLTVYGALALSASNSLPPGYVGVAYSGSLAGSGGSGTSHLTISVVSGLPADGISASANAATLTLSGTPTTPPTTPYTISFSAKLTDSTTNASITQNYSIAVTTPSAPSLPAPNPTSLPAATVNQNYVGSISASGGIGPNYTWTVNGGVIPTNGSLVSIGNGLSVSSDGSSLLTVSGTPAATTPNGSPLSFTAKVKDNATALSSGTQTYTIPVNSAGSQVSGQVFLNSPCGSSNSVPTISLSINTTPVQTVQTDSNGNFSFAAVPNGTYTITPSLFNPPSGAASLFSPTTMTGVTVNNANINNLSFQVQVAYTVSGSVAYSGSHTGRIYLNLVSNNCGGNGGTGTSVASASGFTIHGVAPGSYTLQAWMDPTDIGLGQGVPNSSDPTGNASVTVSNSNFTGANVTVVNNDPGSAPASGPKINAGFGTHNGVVLSYNPVTDSNGTELATSYTVAWSTSATLSSGSLASVNGSATFKAIGNGSDLWILNNSVTGASSFTDGQIYYFQARANNSAGQSPWKVLGGLNPSGVTVGPPSGGNTISGNVTIPAGVTVSNVAQLYVGFYSDTNGVYATQVSSPAVGSNNPFTIHVPSGTWYFFGILDQNNDGVIDVGDVTNTNKNGPPTVVISASGTQNLTLPGGNSDNSVATHFSQQTFWNGSSAQTSIGYNLDFQVRAGSKLPVAVTLTSGPNVIAPVDIGNECQGCGNMRFEYQTSLFNGSTQAPIVPNVGDTYAFTVTYSDGTQDTTGTAAVTGWNGGSTVVGANNAPSSLAPTGASGAGTTPTFTWTDPASSQGSNFNYNFYVYQSTNCSGNCNIWQIPGQNSKTNGFPSTITSITWGTDPTGEGSVPSVGSLTVGDQYNWTVQAADPESNQASTQTWYQP
ncbi:MAG: beta strand repeat-containing protein, partial [Acidobacteriota bacterium]